MENAIRLSLPAELTDLRKRIDAIDETILKLIAERAGLVKHVQDLKCANGMPVRSNERELEMFARARGVAYRLGLSGDDAVRIIRQSIAACLNAAGVGEEGALGGSAGG